MSTVGDEIDGGSDYAEEELRRESEIDRASADDEGSARRRIVESESVRWLQSQTTQHTIDIKQCEPVLPRDDVAKRSEDAQP